MKSFRRVKMVGMAVIVFAVQGLRGGAADAAYVPPTGIPAPPFGIDEVAPSPPASWPTSESAGYYYVDNSHPQATDTSNTYGYPNKPRLTIPTALGAGAYVEVHGGPYTASGIQVNSSGTAASPVFVHGDPANKPLIRATLAPAGGYAIFENLRFDTTGKGVNLSTGGTHHIGIRNCEFAGPGVNAGNQAVIFTSGTATNRGSYFVIYNNQIHDFGDKSVTSNENDYHGVLPGANSDYIWILNNAIYNQGGDGVQAGQATLTDAERPNYVYIGGNTIYGNRENALDVKRVNDIIMSQNDCYGFRSTNSSSGEAIVIHNEAARVWVVNNKVHDSSLGIVTTGSSETYFVGNLIYNIRHEGTFDAGSMYTTGAAIHVRGTTTDTHVIGNTIDNCDVGIQVPTSAVHLVNNIFSNRVEPNGKDVFMGSGASSSPMDYNLFFGGANPVRINWGDGVDRSVASFKAAFAPKGANCPAEADPQYVNRSFHNYRLQSTSPAKDAGVYYATYSTFLFRYGVSIQPDLDGTPRPSGAGWDIGAYEFPEGTSGLRFPDPPTNLTVK